jgi:hypothetical protein
MDLAALPGGELVVKGLADFAAGRESAETFLLQIAGPKLRRLGFDIPAASAGEPVEHRLYLWLAEGDPRRAHSRYNSLLRRIVSFERAARRCAA